MKKNHIYISLIIIVVISSCTGERTSQTKIIGVSQCSDDAWRRTMNNEMKREASFNTGVEIRVKTAHDSNQQQIRDIESFIADEVDLIIL